MASLDSRRDIIQAIPSPTRTHAGTTTIAVASAAPRSSEIETSGSQ
jgi:hypothetical protein